MHEELERLKVPAFRRRLAPKACTSSSRCPKGTSYEAGVLFCQIVATIVATKHPKVATVERMVKRRKDGTVYVDYLQNIPGKTLACAYSARASAFAGVSTPLTWGEVDDEISPKDFTIKTIEARVKRGRRFVGRSAHCEARRSRGGAREADRSERGLHEGSYEGSSRTFDEGSARRFRRQRTAT